MKAAFAMGMFALCSASAWAGPRTLVLGGGQCDDSELTGYVRAFEERLRPRVGDSLLEVSTASERLRPSPALSTEEVQRQIDAAQGHFFSSRLGKADEALTLTLKQISALPPGEARTQLFIQAALLQAQVARELGDNKRMEEGFRRVLRVAPDHQLDPNYFSPSLRSGFESERKKLRGTAKVKLSVRSSPAGGDVFLDGTKVGRTPLHLDTVPGSYSVQVIKADAASFERTVDVRAAHSIHIDLDFEGSVRTRPTPCVVARSEAELLSKAVRVGAMLEVDQVVLMRLEHQSAGPSWLAASLVSVERGQKTREAGLKAQGDSATNEALKDLVEFVVTGQTAPNKVLVVADPLKPSPWSDATAQAATAAAAAPGAPFKTPELSGLRGTLFWTGAGVLAASALTAGIVRVTAGGDMAAYQARLSPEGAAPLDDPEAQRLHDSLSTRSLVLNAALGTAVAGAALAAGAWLWPAAPAAIAVVPAADSLHVTAAGSF